MVLSAVHEADLKHPFLVPPGNGKWVPGNTYVNLKTLDAEAFWELREKKQVMPTLAALLQNKEGKSLGKVVSREEFDHLKKTLDTSHLLGKKWKSDFQDDLEKATLRRLFALFM